MLFRLMAVGALVLTGCNLQKLNPSQKSDLRKTYHTMAEVFNLSTSSYVQDCEIDRTMSIPPEITISGENCDIYLKAKTSGAFGMENQSAVILIEFQAKTEAGRQRFGAHALQIQGTISRNGSDVSATVTGTVDQTTGGRATYRLSWEGSNSAILIRHTLNTTEYEADLSCELNDLKKLVYKLNSETIEENEFYELLDGWGKALKLEAPLAF